MSFQQGLSGLNASSRNLDVIGHNIANSNTVGMKAQRAEFNELVAKSLGTFGNSSGIGVTVATVSQQFSQGNINITNNDMDVAINGAGFMTLALPDGTMAFTRDGQLKMDKDGYIITNSGANLLGYPTDNAGKPLSSGLPQITDKLRLPTYTVSPAQQTTSITASFNLPASDTTVYNAATDTPPMTTYGTSLTVFDSQGTPITFSVNFTRAASTAGPPALDNWEVRDPTGGAPGTVLFTLSFDASGTLVAPAVSPTVTIATPSPTTPTISATFDVSGATQFANSYTVSELSQDGYTSGNLVGVRIDESGVIMARFSNGQTQAKGQIALSNFRNVQGLVPDGNNNWVESYRSGPPMSGSPGTGGFGNIRAGALEDSNVDLTKELVDMMTAQRAYQANAQTIKTQDQVLSTLVNMR